jgi:hypothetical protein
MDSLIARSEYAALDSCVYLNQAALGLIPTRSTSAMLRFMSDVAQYGNLRLSDDEEVRILDERRAAAASLLGTPQLRWPSPGVRAKHWAKPPRSSARSTPL